MTEDLLSKEKGFHQLNKELEQKAYNLMTKINCVVNTYNNGYSISNSKKHQINVSEERKNSNNITTQNEYNFQVPVKRNSSLPHIFSQFSTSKL